MALGKTSAVISLLFSLGFVVTIGSVTRIVTSPIPRKESQTMKREAMAAVNVAMAFLLDGDHHAHEEEETDF